MFVEEGHIAHNMRSIQHKLNSFEIADLSVFCKLENEMLNVNRDLLLFKMNR